MFRPFAGFANPSRNRPTTSLLSGLPYGARSLAVAPGPDRAPSPLSRQPDSGGCRSFRPPSGQPKIDAQRLATARPSRRNARNSLAAIALGISVSRTAGLITALPAIHASGLGAFVLRLGRTDFPRWRTDSSINAAKPKIPRFVPVDPETGPNRPELGGERPTRTFPPGPCRWSWAYAEIADALGILQHERVAGFELPLRREGMAVSATAVQPSSGPDLPSSDRRGLTVRRLNVSIRPLADD